MSKPFTRLFKTIIQLLKDSLETKWFAESDAHLSDDCPFCNNAAWRRSSCHINLCNVCLVPDSICGPRSEFYSTKIWELQDKYEVGALVGDLEESDLLEMQALFYNEIETLDQELKP